MARGGARRRPAELEGDGLALTGLILGWLNVIMLGLGLLVIVLFFGGLAWLAAMSN